MPVKVGPLDITWSKVGRMIASPAYARQVVLGNAMRARAYVQAARERRRLEQGLADFPRSVTLTLTYRCNLRCKMCNLWGERGFCHEEEEKASTQSDLPLEQFVSVYNQIRDRSERLLLFGGEPTLHPRFSELLRAMTPGRVRATLETNGLSLAKLADEILDCEVIDSCNVSIDGPPEIHDVIRGAKGAYEKSMEGVRVLARRAAERGKPMAIGLRYIITDDNFDVMAAFAESVRHEPIQSLLFQHMMYQHDQVWRDQMKFTKQHFGMDVGYDRGFPFAPKRIDPHRVNEQFRAIRRAGLPFHVVINPAYPEEDVVDYYAASDRLPEPKMDCSIIWDHIFIDSRGEAMLCTSITAGNVKEKTVEELWNGEHYRALRQVVRREHHMPYCKICCYLGDKKPMELNG